LSLDSGHDNHKMTTGVISRCAAVRTIHGLANAV